MKLSGTYDGKGDDARAAKDEPSNAKAARDSEAGATDGLETVRDVLVGPPLAEMREEIDRLFSLKPGSSRDVAEIVNRRMVLFEKAIQKKLDRLASRIDTEATQRLEDRARSQERLDEQKHNLEVALDVIGSQIEESAAGLTAQLHGQSRLFGDSIRRTADKLSEHFEREFEMLSWARADRSALAKVVHELATQLEKEESSSRGPSVR